MSQVEIIKANTMLSERGNRAHIERLRVAPYCRVSTDSEDQLNSYKSQVQHYTDFINNRKDWVLVDIYADEAITGTQTKKRNDFQRLINDCMNGEIDMVITKSISRFARNTLDTLNYVRMLKEKNVAVFFEEENINTLTMDGELLLTILSSVAQQEVENISANVKKGLKMKMQRGELVGFQGCLGYDYDKATKAISINEEEAKIVKYIFERYNEGIGCYVIAQELEHLGYKTKRGSSNWAESTVMGILKNEKYKGDIRQGKTFTVDPISKRRLDNFGEEDQFYIHNHHEGIISNELFESVQKIINRRRKSRNTYDGKRETFTRKYSFSCMLECGFCGSHLSRRSWHSGTEYYKVIWQCVTSTKKGKKYCPDAKGIPESIIEEAFLESYKLLCYNNTDVVDEMLDRIEISLCSNNPEKEISNIERLISKNAAKKQKLLDMRLDDTLDKDSFDIKFNELNEQLDELNDRLTSCKNTESREKNIKKRLDDFRKVLEKNEVLVEFDRQVFESIIDKVIVGGYDDDGNKDPSMLTFVYKTGFTNSVDANNHKPPRKNHKKNKEQNENKLSSYSPNEDEKMCSLNSDNTCGEMHFGRKSSFFKYFRRLGVVTLFQHEKRVAAKFGCRHFLFLGKVMSLGQDCIKSVLLQKGRLQVLSCRHADKAAVNSSLRNPFLNLGIIAHQQLIIYVRVVLLKFSDDIRQPMRGNARKRAYSDYSGFQSVKFVCLHLQLAIFLAKAFRMRKQLHSVGGETHSRLASLQNRNPPFIFQIAYHPAYR